MAKKEYPAHLLRSIEINPKGKLFLRYAGQDKDLELTPDEVSAFPLKRIPLFNILKSDSKWKPILEEWFDICLGWRMKFHSEGDIDIEKEINNLRRNLSFGSFSLGLKGKVVNE